MGAINMKLNTGRTMDQGCTLECKMTQEYFDAAAFCEMNPEDMQSLSVNEGDNVKVTTAFGEVVVVAKPDEGCPQGMAFIPMGPWSNAVVNPDTMGCGMPGYKNTDVEVSATDDSVPQIKELMGRYRGETA